MGPAVAAARADHLAAKGVIAPAAYGHAAVAAVGGFAGALNLNTHLVAHPNGAVVPAAAYAPVAPVAAAHGVAHLGLVAHPNGAVVPVDEPAVAAARADHLAALAHGY